MLFLKLCFCYLITLFILINGDDDTNKTGVECTKLLKGQFLCPDPSYDFIDPKTQQPKGCTSNNLASGKITFPPSVFTTQTFCYPLSF